MFLILAASCSAIAALLHLGCIVFGGPWYRFVGAGERMAKLAEAGSWRPTLITLTITAILSLWALYAASGAGIVVKLPLLRPVLCVITSIYLLRGLAGFALIVSPLGRRPRFWFWSSAICLAIGAVHFIGVEQSWEHL